MKPHALVCLLLLPCLGWSDERILDYHSDILVRQDGWIEVTETIEVRAEGVDIRRGIYRDYPTQYEHRFGFDVEVDYEPISVLRDGERENFHTKRRANGLRTYFGSAERHLEPGEYTYTYRYNAMGYDNEAMTAAVVNLAVKGYLCIERDDDVYTLERADPGLKPPDLAVGEKELLANLFRDGPTVVLDNENHELLGKARSKHRASLKRDFAKRYFRTNGAMNLPAILIVVAAVIIALNVGSGATPLAFVILMFMPAVVVVFAILMKQPTGLGRQVLDQAAGFKDYLEIAEKDEMNLRNPPEKTPQLFERYLPFALAMGVDQQWTERFNAVLAGLRAPGSTPYHPVWYTGAWNSHDFSAATSGLTSGLGTAISSSVTAPGSSSGSGGGFSGGGGGGGGGGGW